MAVTFVQERAEVRSGCAGSRGSLTGLVEQRHPQLNELTENTGMKKRIV